MVSKDVEQKINISQDKERCLEKYLVSSKENLIAWRVWPLRPLL